LLAAFARETVRLPGDRRSIEIRPARVGKREIDAVACPLFVLLHAGGARRAD